MRCGRCGNENAEDNRFCGMCGAPLRTEAAAPVRQASTPAGNVAAQRPNAPEPAGRGVTSAPAEAHRGAISSSDDETEPMISGPSFLGLNQPAPRQSATREENRGDGRGHLRTSGNLDYLLEDDEEEPKRGWGKLVFILVALALACGFGYLRWKTGGFDWLTAGINKPAATQPAADTTQKPADNGAATNPAAGAGSNQSGTSAVPSGTAAPSAAAAGSAGPAAAPSGPATAPTGAAAAAPSPGSASATGTTPPSTLQTTSQSATPSTPQAAGAAENPAQGNAATNAAGAPEQANEAQSNSGAAAPAGAASSGTAAATESSQEEQTTQPSTPAHRAAVKPAAPKPAPAKPVDSVAEAQRYIYGSGVRQDCDRGMRMLKSAANRSDAKAMISLGALYSTGTCAPRDLPTAYRWFAMGLHKDPNNQALQDDLQKLWSQMTQPERQLAIKLSQ